MTFWYELLEHEYNIRVLCFNVVIALIASDTGAY